MDTIAPLTTASNTLDTFAKYVRVMEKTGVSFDQFTLPINNRAARRNLADFLKAGCPKLTVPTIGASPLTDMTGYELASAILGKDFITPEEVASVRPGIIYTEAQLDELSDSMPTIDVIRWCQDNGFALMPTPPEAMSLLDVRSLKANHFYSKSGGWYSEDRQKFACDDKIGFGWLIVKKTPVENSTNKNWDEQNRLLSDVERVPNAAEMSWFITTMYEVRGVRLFERTYVRTSSRDSDGDRVDVGDFDAEGLYVDHYWDDLRDGDLGLAAARK